MKDGHSRQYQAQQQYTTGQVFKIPFGENSVSPIPDKDDGECQSDTEDHSKREGKEQRDQYKTKIHPGTRHLLPDAFQQIIDHDRGKQGTII
jgi:hypothetical protein